MRSETKEFIQNWNTKLSQITESNISLKELYEKFTTMYTIYNRYYNEAFYLSESKGRQSDYEKATSISLNFFGPKRFAAKMTGNNQKDLDVIIKLIDDKIFNINLVDGCPQEDTDRKLVENLKSDDAGIKSKAILSLIYNVRCNIVHGHKDFQEYQRLIVEPIINLLQAVIDSFQEKFEST